MTSSPAPPTLRAFALAAAFAAAGVASAAVSLLA